MKVYSLKRKLKPETKRKKKVRKKAKDFVRNQSEVKSYFVNLCFHIVVRFNEYQHYIVSQNLREDSQENPFHQKTMKKENFETFLVIERKELQIKPTKTIKMIHNNNDENNDNK